MGATPSVTSWHLRHLATFGLVLDAGVMLFDINLNSVITASTADHMRSRVAGVYGTINHGARPLGAVVGGLLGSWLGLRPTLAVAALGGVLSCL